MKLLLQCCFAHDSARALYGYAVKHLRRRGVRAEFVASLRNMDLDGYDMLVSHDVLGPEVRARAPSRCYGGSPASRPEILRLLRHLDVPVMEWSLAEDRQAVWRLFDRWGVDRLFLKRSGTCGGKGVVAFDPAWLDQLEWDPQNDVFCPEVNPDDGDLYKGVAFNGSLLVSWVNRRVPLRVGFSGLCTDIKAAYSRPKRRRLPHSVVSLVKRVSRDLTAQGHGVCSFDFMRNPDGDLTCIEMNSGLVATWWMAKFITVRWRYARALHDLVRSTVPA